MKLSIVIDMDRLEPMSDKLKLRAIARMLKRYAAHVDGCESIDALEVNLYSSTLRSHSRYCGFAVVTHAAPTAERVTGAEREEEA